MDLRRKNCPKDVCFAADKTCENALSVYVHIPFCKARCKYCAFSSCVNLELVEPYIARLEREIDSVQIQGTNAVSTVFFGGGTPSFIGGKKLRRVFSALKNKFDFSSCSEVTVECNPESVNDELLSALADCGVNRLSFGLQSVNDLTLQTIGRLHTFDGFLSALNSARSCGFTNVNADLILGLPESDSDFARSVSTVADLPLTHVSVYALELHDGMPFAEYCKTHFPRTDDELADMYDFAASKLASKGFARYEISNFAKPNFECAHNLNYWCEGRYYGFGASASGFVGATRYTNVFGVTDYVAAPNPVAFSERISAHDEQSEFVMLAMRLTDGVNLNSFFNRFGVDFFQRFPEAYNLLLQGCLQRVGDRVIVPPSKIYVVNSILAELLDFDDERAE